MSGGDHDLAYLANLLQGAISPDQVIRNQAEQVLQQLKTNQPGFYLSKLMDFYNTNYTGPTQQLSIILISNFLKKDHHLLSSEMFPPLAEFAKNAFENSENMTSTHAARILVSIYTMSKTNYTAGAHCQFIEDMMMNSLASPDHKTQLKGVRLAENFIEFEGVDEAVTEELRTRIANELVNLLHSPNFEIARKSFDVLMSYGDFADGKEATELFKKSGEGLLKVVVQAFAEDQSLGEELVFKFSDLLAAQKKAFRGSVEVILSSISGLIKQISPEGLQNGGTQLFESLVSLIPGSKSQIFFQFGNTLLTLAKDALSEDSFVGEDKEQETFLMVLEEALVSCTSNYLTRNAKILENLEELTKTLFKSSNWKDIVAGLIVLSAVYRISEDSAKDARCMKAALEWVGNENLQVRIYAFSNIETIVFSESTKAIKKYYQQILDQSFEAYESDSKRLKLCIVRIMAVFFQQKESLKISEEIIQPYTQKASTICLNNIKEIRLDTLPYFDLLAAVFESATEINPEHAELINASFKSLLDYSLSLEPEVRLKSLSKMVKLFAVIGNEEQKKDLKYKILTNIEDLGSKSEEEFNANLDDTNQTLTKEDISAFMILLWKSYLKIYGKEALGDISNHWGEIQKFYSNPTKAKINLHSDDEGFVDPAAEDEINFEMPIECDEQLKEFVTEIIKCDSDRELVAQLETLIIDQVTKGYKYSCYDTASSDNLKEICKQIYNWDYVKNPERAVGFMSSVLRLLCTSFADLSHTADPYDLTGLVLFVTSIVKTVKDLSTDTLEMIYHTFPGRALEEFEQKLKELEEDNEEDEEEGGKGKKSKEKEEEDEEDGSDEESKNSGDEGVADESFDNEDEAAGDREYVWDLMLDICDLWGQLIERLQNKAVVLVQYIVSSVILKWLGKDHYKEKCVGYYSMFAILDHMEPQYIPSSFWPTTQKLYDNSTEDHQGVRHNCAFGLGLVAQKSSAVFAKVGDKIMTRLFEMTTDKKRETTGMKIYTRYLDNVYAAIGKAFASNPQCMKDEYVEKWLKYLPLKYDPDESKLIFIELCKIVEDKESAKNIAGKNGQFYDLVLKKIDESIESEYCDRETGNKLSIAKSKFMLHKSQK